MSDFPYMLGKLPATRPHGVADLSAYSVGRMPEPPATVAVPAVPDWRMCLNDTYGDCVIAGVTHLIMAANAEVSASDTVPTDAQIKQQYFDITGGQDAGCNENDVLHQWADDGLFGGTNKIAAYAPVSVGNLRDLHAAIAFYGGLFVGVQCPQSAQQQFGAGQPWTVVPNSPIEGGHCILFVGYDAEYLYAVTWGRVQPVAYRWWDMYGDEGYAIIPQSFVEKGHGPMLDLASLRSDLGLLD